MTDWHNGPITRDTPWTTTYRTTQAVRRFFTAECGIAIRVDRAFMAWLREGNAATMGAAADELKRRLA